MSGENKGRIIFVAIFIVVLIVAFVAYQQMGSMGIEDRFNTAVGLPSGEEEGARTFFGFSAEGNPILYMVVLGILMLGCYAAYRYFRV